MSYDILLYPRTPGQDWDEIVAADGEDTDDSTLADAGALERGVATFRRIETRLRQALPDDLETWVAEETGGDVYGELSVGDTGLQVELFAESAAVSFPYTDQDDLDAFHAQVRQTVRIVAEETGYEAYDPQTGSSFDGTFADEVGRAATRRLSAADTEQPSPLEDTSADLSTSTDPSTPHPSDGSAATPTVTTPADPRQDPAFLRKRGVLYLVLGVLLTVFGLWRLVTGDSGWLTILVVVIGVMDLLGGVFMLSLSRRAPRAGSTSATTAD